ncbi:MAG TPA: TonB-dependent receptor [Candidatus Acidoferrum sp.]|nr:TonB-dependent receptor [Candidatus Acidoferrum sp.]
MNSALKRIGLLLSVCTLLFAALAKAQTGTSTIRGEISDVQGKMIGGATVTLKNPSIGISRSQTTGASGSYSFELIPPGDYVLEVEAKGFKKAMKNVTASVGSVASADVQLEVGSVNEIVQVEATGAVAVNTEDATLGNNFDNKQVTQLPLEARNILNLLTLQPGVTPMGYVAGARNDQSNITLDGIDINDQQIEATVAGQIVVNSLQTPVLRLNSEAIEEFRVTTLNPNASQGRSSAAQVNLVSKSGTNTFHGAAFEDNRVTIFTANDFFNNRSRLPRPALVRNQFGGALGGPVLKDKVFFFYSYEGLRLAQGQTTVRTVPLASMGLGEMKYLDTGGNIQTLNLTQLNQAFSQVGVNPAAVAVFQTAAQKYPANDFTVGDSSASQQLNTAGFRFNASTPQRLNSNVAKLDWNITKDQTAFVRVNTIYDHIGLLPQFPDTPAPTRWSHPWGIVAAHTWTLGRNWVNNFRYGFTREAFSQLGDSGANNVNFRFVFSPLAFSRTVNRTTPVHNFLDDVSWIKNSHTIQFGTNVRVIRNNRGSFANAFDFAQTNPSGYQQGGVIVSDAISNYLAANNLPAMGSSSISPVQNAGTALIGRFSNYTANFTFAHDGSLLASGSPALRDFATNAYDFYAQDAWKIRRNLTLTYGLRYTLSSPVHETHGFEVRPNIPLGLLLEQRIAASAHGISDNTLFSVSPSGPANGGPPMYNWDYTDFQPRVAIAWQPPFDGGPLRSLFGGSGKSVIRAGFARSTDYYGEALASFFDLNNILGFSSSDVIPVNTYNITTAPAPLFTAFGQDVRGLPKITTPAKLTFPLAQGTGPGGDFGDIEASLDSNLRAPIEDTWSLTVERQLPAGLLFQASYIGRAGRNLLLQRDVAQPIDLLDPKSGMDWYTAATVLEKIRNQRPPGNTAVPTMPYFDNIFPANLRDLMNSYEGLCATPTSRCIPAGFTPTQTVFWIARNIFANDWTDTQYDLEQGLGQSIFFGPQNASLSTWSTVGNSMYHGASFSLRQRFHNLQWDFNYTYSHSLDDASGLQNAGAFGGGSFVRNSIRQHDNYASSDFDLRHVININAIYQLPFGRGKIFAGGASKGLDAFIGGWQLSGIFRRNTGLPINAPIDDARWATNFQVQSWTTLARPLSACPTRGDANNAPKLFGCGPTAAYQSFRNAYPGETGQRNLFRLPGYTNLDLGLDKTFILPWSEKQKLQLRWEVFNVANFQPFGTVDTSRTGFGIAADPAVRNLQAPKNFSNFTAIQGQFRTMQIALRYSF